MPLKSKAQITALLTGSSGFLGRAILEHAPSRMKLVATDQFAPKVQGTTAFQKLDILSCTPSDFEGVDIVIHNAGLFDLTASRSALMRINVDGSRRVAQAAARAGVQYFVHISSTSVYGQMTLPIVENAKKKKPVHAYGESKWLGEEASRAICEVHEIPWASIRPTLIYGPRSRYGIAPLIAIMSQLTKQRTRLPLPKAGPWVHVVHVADVARAIWHVTQRRLCGPFNVADQAPLRLGEMLSLMAHAAGLSPRKVWFPWTIFRPFIARPQIMRPMVRLLELMVKEKTLEKADVTKIPVRLDEDWCEFLASDYVFSIERLLSSGFDFSYPEFHNGLNETVAWYRDARWI